MRKSLDVQHRPTFEDVEPELSFYLTLRFASESFARKIIQEIHKWIDDTDILSLVSDVRIYLCNLAISIGNQLLEDEHGNVA